MIGAAIGDIVGSRFEWHPRKSKEFEFFHPRCRFTDDTVCTAAVADIVMNDRPPAETLQAWCLRHPHRGYGGRFRRWIVREPPRPYGSFGNGAAMRVSAVAHIYRESDLQVALDVSDKVTGVTHNHEEGIKGARATVHAIWLAYRGKSADAIREAIADEYGYDLKRTVDEIRPDYSFDVTCQGTVPEALICAFESVSFEDAIRNAISLGGDADTLGAIAGPIAEVLHGIPEEFKSEAVDTYLDSAQDIRFTLEELYEGSLTMD